MTSIDLESITLKNGMHASRESGTCAMEAVAWLAGEPHSDHPQCACPVVGAFMRRWNDSLPDADRTRLLCPLLPLLVGSRSTPAAEERRSCLALDWLIRTHTPAMLDLVEALRPDAAALRAMPEIVDMTSAEAAGVLVRSVGRRAAARAAAWDVAWAAALDAAWASAWGAAWASALGAALAPTVTTLQASAQDLVRRMCAVTA